MQHSGSTFHPIFSNRWFGTERDCNAGFVSVQCAFKLTITTSFVCFAKPMPAAITDPVLIYAREELKLRASRSR